MRSSSLPPAARVLALGLGLAAAAAIVLAGRIDGSGAATGASALFSVLPPGELELMTAGPLGSADALQPGGPAASGRATVRNQSGRALRLRVRALPSRPDLDRLLRVEISAGGRLVARGPLGRLRRGRRDPAALAPGASRTLAVRAWLAPGAPDGWQARAVEVPLELTTRPAGAGA
jgi:hypothetical protein